MPEYPPEAWERLGRLLKSRRVHLDPDYRYRNAFCERTGLNYKLVQDIEGARRDTFTDETFALFETGYQLAPGAIRRALAGGPLDASEADPPRHLEPAPAAVEQPAADAIDFDLDDFVPQTPAEKALMAIYAATKADRERHREVERKLEDLQTRMDRLVAIREEDDRGQERRGA